ncbi:hypothetical protein AAG906_023542 [Vitis piasezkii]
MEKVVGNNESHNASCLVSRLGATNHCTLDPNNLIIRDTYVGNDQIHMGDGTGLAIQHIGHKNCPTIG